MEGVSPIRPAGRVSWLIIVICFPRGGSDFGSIHILLAIVTKLEFELGKFREMACPRVYL